MTHFWIPRTKIIEPKDAIQLPGIGIAGQMRAIRIGPDGKERWRGPWCKNLWTVGGLDYMFGQIVSEGYFGEVGTGSATPVEGDTSLQARVAQAAGVAMQTFNLVDPGGGTPFYGYETRRYTFNPIGASHNLAEFGVRVGSAILPLAVRSLFRDSGGAPTTVTWLTGETLFVDHQIRFYASPLDITGTLTMGTSNQTHNIILRPSNVSGAGAYINNTAVAFVPPISIGINNGSAWTGTVSLNEYNASVTGTNTNQSTKTLRGYSAGQFYREMQCVWNVSAANHVEGIKAFTCAANPGLHKMSFSPPVMKTDTDTLTMTFSSPVWSNYTP